MFKKLNKIPKFLKEVREELRKVSWSTKQELAGTAVIVIIVTAVLTIYLFIVDSGLAIILKFLFQR